MNWFLFTGILYQILACVFFYMTYLESKEAPPVLSAFIERDGARAYFTKENMNDMWKFVEKDDNVKISSGTIFEEVRRKTVEEAARVAEEYYPEEHPLTNHIQVIADCHNISKAIRKLLENNHA